MYIWLQSPCSYHFPWNDPEQANTLFLNCMNFELGQHRERRIEWHHTVCQSNSAKATAAELRTCSILKTTKRHEPPLTATPSPLPFILPPATHTHREGIRKLLGHKKAWRAWLHSATPGQTAQYFWQRAVRCLCQKEFCNHLAKP